MWQKHQKTNCDERKGSRLYSAYYTVNLVWFKERYLGRVQAIFETASPGPTEQISRCTISAECTGMPSPREYPDGTIRINVLQASYRVHCVFLAQHAVRKSNQHASLFPLPYIFSETHFNPTSVIQPCVNKATHHN